MDKGEAAFGLEWGLYLGRCGSSEGGLHRAPTHLRGSCVTIRAALLSGCCGSQRWEWLP